MNTATVSAPIAITVNTSRGLEEILVSVDAPVVANGACVGRKLRVNKGAVIPRLAPREAVILVDGTKSAVVLGRIALAALDLKRFAK